jgi:DNA adenine methylase
MKPLLKWIGGKQKLLHFIFDHIPKKINNYHELFLGGGSVLLELLEKQKANEILIQKNIYAYDSNATLIAFHKQIQKDHDKLYREVLKLKNNWKNEETDEDKAAYYYKVRALYNSKEIDIEKIAMFVFLNKTGFRGLFRLNKSGGFNVPYGNYKNPKIADINEWEKVSKLIKNVKFICIDFEKLFPNFFLKNINKNDFIYMDPPYVPEKKNGFVSYSKDGFTKEKHHKLFEMCNKINCKFLMSNSNTELVKNELKKFIISIIWARRAINSKNPQSKTIELLIKNYKLHNFLTI